MDIVWYLLGKKAGSLKLPVIPPDAGVLTSIVVGNLPDKTTYIEGEPLDLTGLVILGNFSNGYQYDVTNGCTFTCNDPVTYSDTNITVKYVVLDIERTVDIPITVNGAPVPVPASATVLAHFDNSVANEMVEGGYISCSVPVLYSAGKFGTSLNLDGGSGWAVAVASRKTPSEFGSTKFTWEAWVSCVQAYTYDKLMQQFRGSENGYYSGNYLFAIDTSNRRVQLSNFYRNQSVATTYYAQYPSGNVVANSWHHVAVSFDNGDYKIFFDGVMLSKGRVAGSPSFTSLDFAVYNDNKNYRFDEMMCCNEAKYVADFEPPHGPYYIPQGGE